MPPSAQPSPDVTLHSFKGTFPFILLLGLTTLTPSHSWGDWGPAQIPSTARITANSVEDAHAAKQGVSTSCAWFHLTLTLFPWGLWHYPNLQKRTQLGRAKDENTDLLGCQKSHDAFLQRKTWKKYIMTLPTTQYTHYKNDEKHKWASSRSDASSPLLSTFLAESPLSSPHLSSCVSDLFNSFIKF